MVPFPQSMVVDDLKLDLPECDLYISYVHHPDVALAIIEKQKPVILGVSFGPGTSGRQKPSTRTLLPL